VGNSGFVKIGPESVRVDDPEISFHRYFRTLRNPEHRALYRGKADLTLLEPKLRSLLLTLQQSYNAAFRERGNVFERGSSSEFHVDYVDATVVAAFSFEFESRAFLALSIPLVTAVWGSSERLSRSQALLDQFRTGSRFDPSEMLTIFFLVQMSFIVAHEFAHHDRGHFSSRLEAGEIPNDLVPDAAHGSLDEQAKEIDADGWAVMLNVEHWVSGAGRAGILSALKTEEREGQQADNLLLMIFVASLCAALLLWRPVHVDEANVYQLSHPPQAGRMERILLTIDMWAKDSHPWLTFDATQRKFPALIGAVEEALAPVTGAHNWEQQVGFLRTSVGASYMAALVEQSELIRRQ
jgi:hypothetical protein